VRIAIIGGGIAGLTLALLLHDERVLKHALRTKLRVRLFEKHNLLCPIQRGCTIRRLHPTIHEWPFKEVLTSDFAFSEYGARDKNLCHLHWTAGNAHDVALSVVSAYFKDFAALFGKDMHRAPLDVWQEVSYLHVNEGQKAGRFSIVAAGRRICDSIGTTERLNEEFDYDVVIFASGFGAEVPYTEPARQYRAVSYWRNDDRSQASLYGQAGSYIVSGDGDGALTDVLRLKFLDYQQDLTVLECFPLTSIGQHRLATRLVELHLPDNLSTAQRAEKTDAIASQLAALAYSLGDIRFCDHSQHFDKLQEEWNKTTSYGPRTKHFGALRLVATYFIEPFLRSDISVVLRTGTPKALNKPDDTPRVLPIESVVCNKYAAFYNRVFIYLIWKLSGLRVVQTDTVAEVQVDYDVPDSRVIIRHGVDATAAIKRVVSEGLLIKDIYPKRDEPQPGSVEDRYRSGRRVF
jgi:hypothetical protein